MSREYRTCSADKLKTLISRDSLNFRQVGELLGYSDSCCSKWVKDNQVPVSIDKLVSYMLKDSQQAMLYAIYVQSDKLPAVKSFMQALNIELKELV